MGFGDKTASRKSTLLYAVSFKVAGNPAVLRSTNLEIHAERVRISWNSAEASRQRCLCGLSSAPLPIQVA